VIEVLRGVLSPQGDLYSEYSLETQGLRAGWFLVVEQADNKVVINNIKVKTNALMGL